MRPSWRVLVAVTTVLLITEVVAAENTETRTVNLLNRTTCPRQGLCPHIRRLPYEQPDIYQSRGFPHPSASICGNLCTNDENCPTPKKCCPTTCGYVCHDPVFVTD